MIGKRFKIKLVTAFGLLCTVFSFAAIAQTDSDKPMDAEALAALVKELKEVVSKNSPNEKESALVAQKWDKRKDLAGKTRSEVIDLLYDDVKSVIKDSGIQYQIYSIFSFYKQIPDESPSARTEKTFELKDASKYFDIRIKVAECDDSYCSGKASFSFYKKGGTVPYQVIELPDTQIQLDENGNAQANVTMLYDNQSAVNVGDFNFDGMEDVAICDGANGSYGGPSYRVYLSSRAARKFVYNQAFSDLGTHLGMFEVDAEKKVLRIFDKSGCCWHVTEEYSVVNNRPVKVFVEEEDATIPDETKVKVTTKTLVNGKWLTKVKYVKREE